MLQNFGNAMKISRSTLGFGDWENDVILNVAT